LTRIPTTLDTTTADANTARPDHEPALCTKSTRGAGNAPRPVAKPPVPPATPERLRVTTAGRRVTVSDSTHTKTFRTYKRGLFTFGGVATGAWIDANRAGLTATGMSTSALNVMLGVSENEGNLDAVNTWDSAFLTFGLFQWTIGTRDAKGELPALLKKIRDADAAVFERCYGRHGLGVSAATTATHGHLVLDGQVIDSAARKAPFRVAEWCFRFWKAGLDPVVQRTSVAHAFSRIAVFARSPRYRVNGQDIVDVVTSEYGMALVLDNHVNRPAYIASCLTQAMDAAGLAGSDPKGWDTTDERRLIGHYLTIRERHGHSPMTDAARRAEVTLRYVTEGIISNERGSFVL